MKIRDGPGKGCRHKRGYPNERCQRSSAPPARPNVEIDVAFAGLRGRDPEWRLRRREWRFNRWGRDRLGAPRGARRRCERPPEGAPDGRREKRDPECDDHLPQGGAMRRFHDRNPRMAGAVRSIKDALPRVNAWDVAYDVRPCLQEVGTLVVSARD